MGPSHGQGPHYIPFPINLSYRVKFCRFKLCKHYSYIFCSASGNVLGEYIDTQKSTRFGGVIPSFAMGFHAESLPNVLNKVIEQATGVKCNGVEHLRERGVEVIAVTTKPGLSGSLS